MICLFKLNGTHFSVFFPAADFDFNMLVDYRCVDADRGMVVSYTGKPMPLAESCPHVDKETLQEWAEFSKSLQKLRLTPREHALMLAISLTFPGRLFFIRKC